MRIRRRERERERERERDECLMVEKEEASNLGVTDNRRIDR